MIIEEEHQDELDDGMEDQEEHHDGLEDQEEHHDGLEDQEAEGDEDERPGQPPEVEPQAPLQAELGAGDREEVLGDPMVLRRSTRIRRPPDRLIWNI